MAEKKLSLPEKKKRLTRIKNTLFFSEFLSVITPFVIIGAVNYNDYFVEYDGTRMSIACMLAIALMGISVWLVSKKKFTNSFITLIVGWYAVAFIFFLMGKIVNDIAVIMFIGGSGILGAYGLDIANKKVSVKLEDVKKDMKAAQSSLNQEEYKEELKQQEQEKKTIKVRIKK